MQEVILTQVKDYVSDILKQLETTGIISSIIDNLDNTYSCVCNTTKYLVDYDHLNITGNVNWTGTYQIKNVTKTGFDIIRNSGIVIGMELNFEKKIYFFHGTPKAILKELDSSKKNYADVANIVVLFEPINSMISKANQPYFSNSNLWLCFMKSYKDIWSNDDHYTYAINPMTYLANKFSDKINQYEFEIICHTRYGKFNKYAGYEAMLLGKVSGVELYISLEIPRTYTDC